MTDRSKTLEVMARELRAFKEPGYGSTLLTVLAAWVEEEFPSPREAAMAENSAWDTITAIADLALTAYESHLQAEGMAVVPGWQPIESAPKDRTILLGHPSQVPEAGWWEHCSWFEGWCCGGFRSDMYGPGFEPTHWMPLPAPPASPYGKAVVKEASAEAQSAVAHPLPPSPFQGVNR